MAKALTLCGIKSFSFHYYVLGDGSSLYRKGVQLFQLDIDGLDFYRNLWKWIHNRVMKGSEVEVENVNFRGGLYSGKSTQFQFML